MILPNSSERAQFPSFFLFVGVQVESIQVHADEGGATQTRGGVYWFILPAGCSYLYLLKAFCKIDRILNCRTSSTCLVCSSPMTGRYHERYF